MLADLGQSELSPDGSTFAGIILDPTLPGLVLEMPDFKHARTWPCKCDLGLSANIQEGTLGSHGAMSTRGLKV